MIELYLNNEMREDLLVYDMDKCERCMSDIIIKFTDKQKYFIKEIN